MPLTIVPSPPFHALESVSLGRFVTNIDQPHEGYYEPKTPQPSPIVAHFNFTGHNGREAKTSFGTSLVKIFSTSVSKLAGERIQVEADEGTSYCLDNSEAWFDNALALPDTKAWIERAALRSRTVYLVVGVQTLTNPSVRFDATGDTQKQASVQVSPLLRATPASMFVTASGLDDTPSLSAETARNHISQRRLAAAGEFVCAMQYRKLKYRWLSRRSLQGVQLSKTRQWCYLTGKTRAIPEPRSDKPSSELHQAQPISDDSNPTSDDDNDDEDLIEVDFATDDDIE